MKTIIRILLICTTAAVVAATRTSGAPYRVGKKQLAPRFTRFMLHFLFLTLMALAACGQKEQKKSKDIQVCKDRKSIEEIKDQKATLAYSTQLKAYTVSYLPVNTIDSRVLALICNPDKNMLTPLIGEVRFNGILKDIGKDIPPVLGIDYYYIELKKYLDNEIEKNSLLRTDIYFDIILYLL